MKPAIGTSLAIIAVNCLGGFIGQLRYMDFDWRITIGFLAAAIAGMFAGTALTGRLTTSTLRRGFAWCVLLVGVALVGWNGMALIGTR
jgi:uncharacterized membrane protein YfcA